VQYSLTTDLRDPVDEMKGGVEDQRRRLQALGPESLRPVVVGTGPGGIFCAYWLRLHGVKPVLLEQGPPMRQRVRDMARFMKTGDLHPYSNICFGAGGAGTYSDGKLITRIRSPYRWYSVGNRESSTAREPLSTRSTRRNSGMRRRKKYRISN